MRREIRPNVGENLLRGENCARNGTEEDFGDGVENGLNGVLGYSRAQLLQPIEFAVADFLPVVFFFQVEVTKFLGSSKTRFLRFFKKIFRVRLTELAVVLKMRVHL